jgi:hypothetical protein
MLLLKLSLFKPMTQQRDTQSTQQQQQNQQTQSIVTQQQHQQDCNMTSSLSSTSSTHDLHSSLPSSDRGNNKRKQIDDAHHSPPSKRSRRMDDTSEITELALVSSDPPTSEQLEEYFDALTTDLQHVEQLVGFSKFHCNKVKKDKKAFKQAEKQERRADQNYVSARNEFNAKFIEYQELAGDNNNIDTELKKLELQMDRLKAKKESNVKRQREIEDVALNYDYATEFGKTHVQAESDLKVAKEALDDSTTTCDAFQARIAHEQTKWKNKSPQKILRKSGLVPTYVSLKVLDSKQLLILRRAMKKFGILEARNFNLSKNGKDDQLRDVCHAFNIEIPEEQVEDFEALEIEEEERILRESKAFLS